MIIWCSGFVYGGCLIFSISFPSLKPDGNDDNCTTFYNNEQCQTNSTYSCLREVNDYFSVISSMSSSEFLPQNVTRLVSLTLAIGCEFMRVEPFSISETMIWNMFFLKFVINLTRNSKIFQKVCDSLRPKIN